MKLSYRGIAYNSNNEVLAATETETELNFLGAHYKMPAAHQASARRSPSGLMFRGVAY
jgi:hypothetical protein